MNKVLKKLKIRRKQEPASRITSETIAEHRQRILAGGRRFKYPVQYARHRLVFNAIIISVAAVIVAGVVGYQQLYYAQNTSTFMYRVTRVLPIPVANIDGQNVPYSDYLMKYLSSVHYLQTKEQVVINSTDGKRQVAYIKEQAMDDSIADAYAAKLANQLHLSVSDKELNAFIAGQRQSSDGMVSEQTYDAVILDYYGWSPSEYQYATKEKLLRQKVMFAVDKTATQTVTTVGDQLKGSNADFQAIVKTLTDQKIDVTYGASGLVPKTNQDGGLAEAASKLQKGQVSTAIKSTTGEGYYYVRLLDSNSTQVSYDYIEIPLQTFKNDLAALKQDKKFKEYISIPKSTSDNQ